MKQFTYTIRDELGIHARPAGQLAKLAKSFPDTTATITKEDRSTHSAGIRSAGGVRMKLLMTHGTSTRDVTELMVSWNWSGDKASISRQLTGEISYVEGGNLPVPALGDVVTMVNDGKRLFVGIILLRSLSSESSTLSFTAFDYGYYLQQNDGTYKFTGAAAEAQTQAVCKDRKIPVAGLPVTGIPLRRKYAAVRLSQIITTAWTLTGEKTGKSYAIRYTPEGLLVKERDVGGSSLVLRTSSMIFSYHRCLERRQ